MKFTGRRILPDLALLFVFLILSVSASVAGTEAEYPVLSQEKLLEPGVSRELARLRAKTMSEVTYRLSFSVREGEKISGRVDLYFDFHPREASPLVLDFAGMSVDSVVLNGESVNFGFRDEHIIIRSGACRQGGNSVRVEFHPDERPFHREKDYLYTLFVPDKARLAFPCFDQPDLKARFVLRLEVPRDWIAVSNSRVVRDSLSSRARVVEFAGTPPLSTYLFSFVAGRFGSKSCSRNGRELWMYYLPDDSTKVTQNAPDMFELHFAALDWLEEYTGIDYPFDKFAFVLIPSFPYSGMEHPGGVLYRSERLLLGERPTKMELLRRAGVISHETSHMWFGDLVTMRWFDDVWLKEAFAQFMADKIVRPSFPEMDHRLLFFSSHMETLYEVERSRGTHPIMQKLENLARAGSLYGNIIYHKPPVMLNQLEKIMGADSLRAALKEYLGKYAFGNASWEELVRILDKHSTNDIVAWSRVWVEEEGRPEFSVRVERDNDGVIKKLVVEQGDPGERGLLWPEKFHVLLSGPGERSLEVFADSRRTEVDSAGGVKADAIFLDSRGEGFGLFRLDPSILDDCCIYEFGEPIERAVYSFELWDNLLEGAAITPYAYAEYLYELFGNEDNELIIQANLHRFEEFFWNFLPDGMRLEWGERFERLFLERMRSGLSPSVKRAYFKTFMRTVLTSSGTETLRELWMGELEIPEMKFSQRDYCDMALELSVRDVEGWREILREQLGRIKNQELRERFAFVMPAASPVPEERTNFFEGLALKENRRHEPWVLEGVYYLHHPLRRFESIQFIEPSLDMLEEIEKTGDIFFPKEWIKATMRYHNSADALRIVERFLMEHPDYPGRLGRIIRQATDMVERAHGYRRNYY